jgi:hypothetical protein
MDEEESKIYSKVPAKVTQWSSFKSFLTQEIKLELTPYESKIFKEVSNFWNQEIYFKKGFHVRPAGSAQFEEQVVAVGDEPEIKINL